MVRRRNPPSLAESLFTSAVEQIYAAALEPERWPTALQAFADVTGDVGAILLFSRDDGRYGVIETQSLRDVVRDYRENGWDRRDVRAIRCSERGFFFKRDIVTDRDILSDEELETEPFYSNFLTRHNLRYFAAVMVSPDPRVGVTVSVQRTFGGSKYRESELRALRRLGPHVERSLRISLRLMNSESLKRSMGDALSRVDTGVFALDAISRVTYMNEAARRLLGDGLELSHDRLRVVQMRDVTAQTSSRELLDLSAEYAFHRTAPLLIRRRLCDRSIALYFLPVSELSSEFPAFLTHVHALILAVDLAPGMPPEPATVRDLHGLTLGEARVASLIGSGLSPRDAARQLSITEETARTVLKRVFSKTGVSRQGELAALMSRLALR